MHLSVFHSSVLALFRVTGLIAQHPHELHDVFLVSNARFQNVLPGVGHNQVPQNLLFLFARFSQHDPGIAAVHHIFTDGSSQLALQSQRQMLNRNRIRLTITPLSVILVYPTKGTERAEVLIDEQRLQELIEKTVQKQIRLTVEDVDEVRRSPAGTILRLETRVEAIEKNMATKADIAILRTEIAEVGTELKEDIAQVRSEVAGVRTELKENIAQVRTELKQEIAELRTEMRERFGKLEASQRLMLALMLSMFGAVIATLIKLFFFS